MNSTRRQFFGAALVGQVANRLASATPAPLFPQLANCGDDFRFIINADPHVNREKRAPHLHNLALEAFVKEVNGMNPQPAFVLFNGDIFEREFFPETTDSTVRIVKDLKTLPIAVTGNHDCRDFDVDRIFRPVQKAFNGTTGDTFSFDAGRWHFVAMPTRELILTREKQQAFLTWLDQDLAANRARPTIAFMHYHLLPVGTSQMEYYSYSIDYKNRLAETLARYGNVNYVFSGHVHAGIEPSVKTAWRYQDVNFVVAPSPVKPRPFGEDYADFTLDGGYYLIVEIKGAEARLLGHQTGRAGEHVYPSTFRECQKAADPRCFTAAWDLPANPCLENGGFDKALSGWQTPCRYISDRDPGYVWNSTGDGTAHLAVHEKGQGWAVGEFTELYQVIQIPRGAAPALEARYKPAAATGGGGYLWVAGFKGKQAQCMMLFHWGPKMNVTHPLRRTIGYLLAAGQGDEGAGMQALTRRNQALFFPLPSEPDQWHRVKIGLADAMDQAAGAPGAFKKLGVDRMIVALGVWCSIPAGSKSEAWFDDIDVRFDAPAGQMTIDGHPFDAKRNGLHLVAD
jgi:hypothetical protein